MTARAAETGCCAGSASSVSRTGGWTSTSPCRRPSREVTSVRRQTGRMNSLTVSMECSWTHPAGVCQTCPSSLTSTLPLSVLSGLPGQTGTVPGAAGPSGLLHAAAVHAPRAVGLLGGPEVSDGGGGSGGRLWAELTWSPLRLRFVEWIPELPADVGWLVGLAGDVYGQVWRGAPPSGRAQ